MAGTDSFAGLDVSFPAMVISVAPEEGCNALLLTADNGICWTYASWLKVMP